MPAVTESGRGDSGFHRTKLPILRVFSRERRRTVPLRAPSGTFCLRASIHFFSVRYPVSAGYSYGIPAFFVPGFSARKRQKAQNLFYYDIIESLDCQVQRIPEKSRFPVFPVRFRTYIWRFPLPFPEARENVAFGRSLHLVGVSILLTFLHRFSV